MRRRCHAAVGYGPKTLQRVLRFRRFVSRIDAYPKNPKYPKYPKSAKSLDILDLAAIAAEAGYVDQAHLTRECGRLLRPDSGRAGQAASALAGGA